MISFGFFYSTSMKLGNLLERTELFSVSQEIREQLVLALADLVTLVASVSMHFHKAILGLTEASISIDLYKTFPGQIQTFRDRCEKISEAMWRHQLLRENLDVDKGTSIPLSIWKPLTRNSVRSEGNQAMAEPRRWCSR
jgi:hypothetical protein